jgi:hypothetical protein
MLPQGPFPQDQTWKVLNAMLADQLIDVDVQAISEKDFNADGDIIMTPPSVRTFYAGTGYEATSDLQRLSYDVAGRFMILCGAQDLTSAIAQAQASARLADQVCGILAGARLNLPNGDQSIPVLLKAIEPLPIDGLGMGYAVAIEVPGLAQMPGTNAAGYTAQGVE